MSISECKKELSIQIITKINVQLIYNISISTFETRIKGRILALG